MRCSICLLCQDRDAQYVYLYGYIEDYDQNWDSKFSPVICTTVPPCLCQGHLYPPLDLDRKNPREPKAAELGPEDDLGPSGCSTASLANEDQGWKEQAWGWGSGITISHCGQKTEKQNKHRGERCQPTWKHKYLAPDSVDAICPHRVASQEHKPHRSMHRESHRPYV